MWLNVICLIQVIESSSCTKSFSLIQNRPNAIKRSGCQIFKYVCKHFKRSDNSFCYWRWEQIKMQCLNSKKEKQFRTFQLHRYYIICILYFLLYHLILYIVYEIYIIVTNIKYSFLDTPVSL